MRNLQAAGVRRVFIDGSFVTTKANPNDIDGCWEWNEDVDLDLPDPVFLNFSRKRQAMKEKYRVDFFLATWVEVGSGLTLLLFHSYPWSFGQATPGCVSSFVPCAFSRLQIFYTLRVR